MTERDDKYLEIVLDAIRVSGRYRPKFGRGAKGGGLTFGQFQELYRSDAFYSWFGLDDPLMYAAHKAAGGMTSVYRQIGIGCETLFRQIIQDSFRLSDEEATWSYHVDFPNGRRRKLSLDGRIPLESVNDGNKRVMLKAWMRGSSQELDVEESVFENLMGIVFEVRQGYKSKDSKRQNADIANAATAYARGYLPCAVVLSGQIDSDVLVRYRAAKWTVLTGTIGASDPLVSTYDFMREVVGYDLAAFFGRNSASLRDQIGTVLRALLERNTT